MHLKGTVNCGLMYGKTKANDEVLEGYVDSDYAGDLDKRTSLTGYILMLNGCAVNWKATLQSVVALSTTEAEYTAATEVVKETLWLKGLVTELGLNKKSVSICCENGEDSY